jgi:hypothetical protein
VREGRHDDSIEVRDDCLERFRLDRRRCRKLTLDVAGFGAGHHRQRGGAGAVVGDPVDNAVTGGAKFFGGHRGRL